MRTNAQGQYEDNGRMDRVNGEIYAEGAWHPSSRHDYVHTTAGDSSTFASFPMQPQAPIRELMIWACGEVHPGHGP